MKFVKIYPLFFVQYCQFDVFLSSISKIKTPPEEKSCGSV